MAGKALKTPEFRRGSDFVEAKMGAIRDVGLVESRRQQLLGAALELFLKKGYASTTIRDICARSGVNQASLYDYVANKHDILRRLLNNLWCRDDNPSLPDRLADPDAPPLERILDEIFKDSWGARRKGTLLAYRTVPHLDAQDRDVLRDREMSRNADLAFQLRRHTGAADDDERVEVVANVITYMTAFGPLRGWLTRDLDHDKVRATVVKGVVAMIDDLREPPKTPS